MPARVRCFRACARAIETLGRSRAIDVVTRAFVFARTGRSWGGRGVEATLITHGRLSAAIERRRVVGDALSKRRLPLRPPPPHGGRVSTWAGVIAETHGSAAFWDAARRLGVHTARTDTPPFVLVETGAGDGVPALAASLARETGGACVGFLAQTNADTYALDAYEGEKLVRRLAYARDQGGWRTVEGTAQPWENAFFFDEPRGAWPALLRDEISADDLARYDAARDAGDAAGVLDLLHPSSTAPLFRLCASFGVDGNAPAATWRPRGVNPRALIVVAAVAVFLAGMFLLGVLRS